MLGATPIARLASVMATRARAGGSVQAVCLLQNQKAMQTTDVYRLVLFLGFEDERLKGL